MDGFLVVDAVDGPAALALFRLLRPGLAEAQARGLTAVEERSVKVVLAAAQAELDRQRTAIGPAVLESAVLGTHSGHALLNTTDAASRYGCQPRQIRRLVASGRLTEHRLGRALLIDPDELAELMEARTA